MEKIKIIKIGLIGIFTVINTWLGGLAIPLYLLLILMIIDYLTALRAASHRGQKLDSKKGIKGIEKKVFMLVLILIGGLTDIFLAYLVSSMGFTMPVTTPIAIMISLWLVINEIISVLENVKDILGDRVPDWLMKLLENVKSKINDLSAEDDKNE